MADSVDSSDVVLNKYNLLQARSRKILQSWLPPSAPVEAVDEDGEDDFNSMSELGGIGSKRAHDGDDSVAEPLRNKRAVNDKLMEQLLGKKAAQAKKKSLEAQKSTSILKRSPLRPTTDARRTQHDVESDEENGGRAAAFISQKSSKALVTPDNKAVLPTSESFDDVHDGLGQKSHDANERSRISTLNTTSNGRQAQKKATSYLDELLAQKAGKKKKKRRKGKIEGSN